MTSWMVYPHSEKFVSGSEVNLCESPQVDGDPPSQLAVGNEITFVWPNGERSSRKIVAASATTCTVHIESKQTRIRQSRNGDSVRPIKSAMNIIPWIVV